MRNSTDSLKSYILLPMISGSRPDQKYAKRVIRNVPFGKL